MSNEEIDLYSIDILKNIAIILVVLGHAGCIYSGRWSYTVYNNESNVIKYITDIIYSIHMQLFVFISGYIYNYNREKKNKYTDKIKFIINKAKRLLVPYVLTGVLFMIPLQTVFNVYRDEMLIRERIVNGILLAKQPAHLWYLLMLFNIFIIFRVLEKQINKQNYILNLIIMILISFRANDMTEWYQIPNTFRYLPYFYTGYLFSRNIEKIMKLKVNNKLVFSIYFVIFNLYHMSSLYNNMSDSVRYIRITIIYIIACLGIVSLFIWVFKRVDKFNRFKKSKVYTAINKYNFYIYLVHQPIMIVLIKLIKDIDIPAYGVYIFLFAATMIVSIFLSNVIFKTIVALTAHK